MSRELTKLLLSILVRLGVPLLAATCLVVSVAPARGEEDDLRYLELYNGTSVQMVSADRSPRPASQTAENITVVTAKEIEALNAHTLADVLFTVTGVQLEEMRTPGTPINLDIQGSLFNHILVLIDNVPLNNLADNFPDISSVPVQMIDRIEVVKGAASSSWGNALGGVVNVITKAPLMDRAAAGLVSASIGKDFTADGRAEATGTVDRFGYYLTGGKLHSDGLVPHNDSNLSNVYGKLTYDLPVKGSLALTTSFTDNSGGIVKGQVPETPVQLTSDQDDVRRLISTLSAQYPFSDRLSIEAGLRTKRFDSNRKVSLNLVPTGDLVRSTNTNDEEVDNGGSVKVSWLDELQRIVAGVDYDHVSARLRDPQGQADQLNSTDDRVGVYLTDTFTWGHFAITPSARFDHMKIGGNLFSPSFGITYALTENTVLRGYTARGYSLTSLNRDDSTEKVWTSQVGFETADLPYVWLKGTLFRNDTWDIKVGPAQTQSQLKQGFEVEARTLPIFNTSLLVGYTFIDATNEETDATIRGIGRHTVNVSIKYEDPRYLRALLTGHYVDWNADPTQQGKYGDIIWDLYLAKKFSYSEFGGIELFVSIRNLFDGEQYLSIYKNPGRWAEGGIRCTF